MRNCPGRGSTSRERTTLSKCDKVIGLASALDGFILVDEENQIRRPSAQFRNATNDSKNYKDSKN